MTARTEKAKQVANAPHKPYLTPNEVAALFMVSPITVRQWAQKGLLKAEVTLGGHRRFLRDEIERFARGHGMTGGLTAAGGDARLLVVDDDRQLVSYIGELLSAIEHLQIETAYDGFEAGTKMQTLRPHMVLLDLMMPGLNGFEVCRRIKTDNLTRDARVVTMTGYASAENTDNSLGAGAESCLCKPLDAASLMKLARSAVRAVRQTSMAALDVALSARQA